MAIIIIIVMPHAYMVVMAIKYCHAWYYNISTNSKSHNIVYIAIAM